MIPTSLMTLAIVRKIINIISLLPFDSKKDGKKQRFSRPPQINKTWRWPGPTSHQPRFLGGWGGGVVQSLGLFLEIGFSQGGQGWISAEGLAGFCWWGRTKNHQKMGKCFKGGGGRLLDLIVVPSLGLITLCQVEFICWKSKIVADNVQVGRRVSFWRARCFERTLRFWGGI